MRKYYKPCNIRKRDVTAKLSTRVDPWGLLAAFMQGARSLLSPEICEMADRCVAQRSVSSYLVLSKFIDSRTQSYPSDLSNYTVWCERQLCVLLKKYPFEQSESDLVSSPRETAILKWRQSEQKCKETNLRLSSDLDGPSWLPRARQLAAEVLGDLSPERVMNIITLGTHGPGSTLSSVKNRVSAYYKFADLPYTCTAQALPYAYAAITSDQKWMDYIKRRVQLPTIPMEGSSRVQVELMYLTRAIEVVDSDKITFTPKDCQTDRPIAVGASLNIFLQLGVKADLERCLQNFGIDLTDQTKNQEYARLGSLWHLRNGTLNENQFSTVDLASASDTISYEFVKRLLPAEWFAFLSDLRHATGVLPDGSTWEYEKFSAMGNGFTFPLESLVFFCVCKAASEHNGIVSTPNDITIFGDDIIVRHRAIPFVLDALNWSGFEVNSAKSFLSGPFKESCGADFYNGVNVRPFYLKRVIRTREDIYFVANSLMKLLVSSEMATPWIHSMYDYLVNLIPSQYRSYGPMDWDSSYLSVPFQSLGKGVRPFLSQKEMLSLEQAHMLGDVFQNSPCVVRTLTLPVCYRARQDVLYLLKLRLFGCGSSLEWIDNELRIRAESVEYATRREAIRRSVVVSSVPSWNAELRPQQIARALTLL